MRIALLTEGGYPYARGESALWCERLLRGLDGHEFGVYALSRGPRQEAAGRRELPRNVVSVRTAPLWGSGLRAGGDGGGSSYGRRERRRFAEHFAVLAESVCAAETGEDGEGPASGRPAGRSAAAQADRFAAGLYGLAELAFERGGLACALRSELAVRILESACRAPGALRAAHAARVADLLAVTERLERALRPLSLDWYGLRGEDPGLSAADLCHAVGGGLAALPGLLARRAYGVPLLITEYGVRLREHYLASAAGAVAPRSAGAPVRALLASFQGRLTREAYAQAQLITPGNAHARRWQERCGAHPARLRTVYPGMDAAPFDAVGERTEPVPPAAGPWQRPAPTLVWVGSSEPSKDVIALLHAFAHVRGAVPDARLRIIETGTRGGSGRREGVGGPGWAGGPGGVGGSGGAAPCAADGTGGAERSASAGRAGGSEGSTSTEGSASSEGVVSGEESAGVADYAARCRALAARLFPRETAGARPRDHVPVSFEELGSPAVPTLAEAYAAGSVVVLSSVVEGFPVSLVEAMFCGRATVSTDVGAVCEVIGGTGLVVPPHNPRALADVCVALLCDPARAALLGAAARSRALELFTVEQNTESFRGIYLEVMSHRSACEAGEGAGAPVGQGDEDGSRPFECPAEAHVPGRWAGTARRVAAAATGGRRTGADPGQRRTAAEAQAGSQAPTPSWAVPDRSLESVTDRAPGAPAGASGDNGGHARATRAAPGAPAAPAEGSAPAVVGTDPREAEAR